MKIAELKKKVVENDRIIRTDDYTESIREHGILTPLVIGRYKSGKEILVDGHCRLADAEKAGLEEIPDEMIRYYPVDNIFDVRSLRLTFNRSQDLTLEEELHAVGRLRSNNSRETVAKILGRSEKWVRIRELAHKAPQEILDLVYEKTEAKEEAVMRIAFIMDLDEKHRTELVSRDYFKNRICTARGYKAFVQAITEAIADLTLSNAAFDKTECEKCPKRTDRSLLWADEAEATCLDRSCFIAKQTAYRQGQVEAWEADGWDFFYDYYGSVPKDLKFKRKIYTRNDTSKPYYKSEDYEEVKLTLKVVSPSKFGQEITVSTWKKKDKGKTQEDGTPDERITPKQGKVLLAEKKERAEERLLLKRRHAMIELLEKKFKHRNPIIGMHGDRAIPLFLYFCKAGNSVLCDTPLTFEQLASHVCQQFDSFLTTLDRNRKVEKMWTVARELFDFLYQPVDEWAEAVIEANPRPKSWLKNWPDTADPRKVWGEETLTRHFTEITELHHPFVTKTAPMYQPRPYVAPAAEAETTDSPNDPEPEEDPEAGSEYLCVNCGAGISEEQYDEVGLCEDCVEASGADDEDEDE